MYEYTTYCAVSPYPSSVAGDLHSDSMTVLCVKKFAMEFYEDLEQKEDCIVILLPSYEQESLNNDSMSMFCGRRVGEMPNVCMAIFCSRRVAEGFHDNLL